MVEPWDAMVKAAMAGTHKAQDGLLDGCKVLVVAMLPGAVVLPR
jgi:hypothetical protein